MQSITSQQSIVSSPHYQHNKNFDDFMDMKNLRIVTQPSVEQILSPRKRAFQISDLTTKRLQNSRNNNTSLPKLSNLVVVPPDVRSPTLHMHGSSRSTPKMGHIASIKSEQHLIVNKEINIQVYFQLNDKTLIKTNQLMKRKNIKLLCAIQRERRLKSINSHSMQPPDLIDTFNRRGNRLSFVGLEKAAAPPTTKQYLGSFHLHNNNDNNQRVVVPPSRKKIPQQLSEAQNDQFFVRLQADPIIGQRFAGYNVEVLKSIHQSLLSTAFGGQLHFNVESMRDKHANMQLSKCHFSTLKRHYMQFLLEYGVCSTTIMQFAAKLEHYKPFIINKPTLYDQVGKDHGIVQLAMQLQALITQDYILNVYFEKFDAKQRTHILGRFLSTLINVPEATTQLREHHKHMQLTHVHFTQLKFYLAQVLHSSKISLKSIAKILSSMDTFKSSILDKDSILELVERQEGGMQDFIIPYVKMCQDDPHINAMITKRGLDKFVRYAELFFYYMFNKHPNQINLDDFKVLNKGKMEISLQVFNALKNKALKLISALRPDQILFEDFSESWDEIQQLVITKKQVKLPEAQQQNFLKSITYEIQQMPILIKIYNDADVDVEKNIMKKMFCLSHHQKYYKKSDMKNIHRLYKIHDYTFDQFLNIFRSQIQDTDQSWMVAKIESYRSSIVSD